MTFSPVGTSYYYSGGEPFGKTETKSIFSEKDTMVNGLLNRKLIVDRTWQQFREKEQASKGYMLVRQSNDSIFFDGTLAYYLGGKEKDTTQITVGAEPNYLILDSIRYKEYFSALRKVFYFRHVEEGCRFFEKVTFVENYGPIDADLTLSLLQQCYLLGNLPTLYYQCGSFEQTQFTTQGCEPLSILGSNDVKHFTIFPNPVTSEINFDLHNINSYIKIFNSQGIQAFETFVPDIGLNTINVSNLPSGIYHVQVNGRFKKAIQFLKQ